MYIGRISQDKKEDAADSRKIVLFEEGSELVLVGVMVFMVFWDC